MCSIIVSFLHNNLFIQITSEIAFLENTLSRRFIPEHWWGTKVQLNLHGRQHLTFDPCVGHFPGTKLPPEQSEVSLQVPPTTWQSSSWKGALTSGTDPPRRSGELVYCESRRSWTPIGMIINPFIEKLH